jgi:hypothetical protein
VYFPVLLALTAVSGFESLQRLCQKRASQRHLRVRHSWVRWGTPAVASTAIALASVTFFTMSPATSLSNYPHAWGNPNDATVADINTLVHDDVRFAYANYWVAYVLDFTSKGRISASPLLCPRVQYPPLYHVVQSSGIPAWLFVAPTNLDRATKQFGETDLELNESEQKFLSEIARAGIPYHIVRAGVLDAVVPARPLTPKLVGIRGCT